MEEKVKLFFEIPKEDSAIPLKVSYLEIEFNLTHKAGAHARYADGDRKKVVNLGPFALFIKYILKSFSGKCSCYLFTV